jgi:hypothetical protein
VQRFINFLAPGKLFPALRKVQLIADQVFVYLGKLRL